VGNDLRSLESTVKNLTDRMGAADRSVSDSRSRVDGLTRSISDSKECIADLFHEKRNSHYSYRQGIQDSIEDQLYRKKQLIDEIREAKSELREAIGTSKRIRSEANSESRQLTKQVENHIRNLRQSGSTALPASARGEAIRLQDINKNAAQRLHDMLLSLRRELGRGNTEELGENELTYVPIEGVKTWPDAVPLADGTPSAIHPIDGERSFYDIGDGRSILIDYHDVTDTIHPSGSGPQDKEAFGVAYACEYLRTEGHVIIEELGGSHAPDILSVGRSTGGRLVVTEAKGTTTGARIDQMNLAATLADGTERLENERGNLRRTGPLVLRRLTRDIDSCGDPKRKQDLMALRSEFGRMVQRGFVPGEYDTQIVQVGWVDSSVDRETSSVDKDTRLRPASLIEGERWREYLRAAQPNRVVQINVHAGSEQARASDNAREDRSNGTSPADNPSDTGSE
jgi:hypothetical protein